MLLSGSHTAPRTCVYRGPRSYSLKGIAGAGPRRCYQPCPSAPQTQGPVRHYRTSTCPGAGWPQGSAHCPCTSSALSAVPTLARALCPPTCLSERNAGHRAPKGDLGHTCTGRVRGPCNYSGGPACGISAQSASPLGALLLEGWGSGKRSAGQMRMWVQGRVGVAPQCLRSEHDCPLWRWRGAGVGPGPGLSCLCGCHQAGTVHSSGRVQGACEWRVCSSPSLDKSDAKT